MTTAGMYQPSPDGAPSPRFIWACDGQRGADVVLKRRGDRYGRSLSAETLARDWNRLVDELAEMEAERDKWRGIALRLADAVQPELTGIASHGSAEVAK